jgi:hypothetical protein
MATLAQVNPLEATARTILAGIALPKGVRLLRIFFDSDWSGDPATRVVYGVSKRHPLTKLRVHELTKLSIATESALAAIREGGLVYVSFEDVR